LESGQFVRSGFASVVTNLGSSQSGQREAELGLGTVGQRQQAAGGLTVAGGLKAADRVAADAMIAMPGGDHPAESREEGVAVVERGRYPDQDERQIDDRHAPDLRLDPDGLSGRPDYILHE
jgi:hypothetical protein